MAGLNESFYANPKATRAVKKHGKRIGMVESVRKQNNLPELTFEQKVATAMALENTSQRIKVTEALNYGGATQPSSIGQYKRFAMDMVGTLVPSLIASDLVSVQALDNKVGTINILQYQYGTTKGSAKAGETFASPLGYQGMNPTYTSSAVDGEDLFAGADGKYYLQYTPVKAGTVRVIDATGAVKTVDLVDAFTGEISGVADGDKAYYLYDNETAPVTAPQIKLDIKSLPVETKSRKLSAIWSFDAQYELMKEYGQEMQQLLATQATAEIEQEIDNEITLDLYNVANAGPEITWSRVQPHGVNIVDHYDSFWNEIVKGSNAIYNATRKAHANFMVCGLNVDAVLKTMRNFDSANDTTSVGPHYIGSIGNIKCYVNPNYDADTFVLGYKGNNFLDAGYVYCPYMPILTTGMVTLADDFGSREGWATSYGKKVVNPRLYIKGRII